jgi:cytochrome c-type biogenesis protein CcsB
MSIHIANGILKLATLFYILSMLGYAYFLFNQKKLYQKLSLGLMGLAVVIHFISLTVHTAAFGHIPVYNLSQTLSIAAFALGAMFLFVQYRSDLNVLGVFASILISLIMVFALILPDAPAAANETLKGFWFYVHIGLIFSGEASLALSCGTGIMYLLQEKGIKTKAPGFFFKRLPSLDFLDKVAYACLTTGFALMTIGLAAGFIYAKIIWGKFWNWDIRELLSVGNWLVYAALIHFRLYSGWQGRKSAILTIIGFTIIIFAFLVVKLFIDSHHYTFTQ